jgi:hypothetical protein
MTIRRNPNRGNQEAREAFVNQAAAEDKTRLHCFIPSELHHQIKLMAVEGRTDMTALVIEALEQYVAQKRA